MSVRYIAPSLFMLLTVLESEQKAAWVTIAATLNKGMPQNMDPQSERQSHDDPASQTAVGETNAYPPVTFTDDRLTS